MLSALLTSACLALADAPHLARLEVTPGTRVLHAPARWQQLSVRAYFKAGVNRDVTRLCVFSSSDPAVADVDRTGLVEFRQPGEVAILVRYLETIQTVNLAYLEEKPGFTWSIPAEKNFVDTHVFAKLKTLSIAPSDLCSDEDFLRRVYLDLCAVLPTPDEVRAFRADADKDKRASVIDRLLARPEFADFWTLKWLDILRANRKSLGKGADAYRTWLLEHLKKNTPFDKVVRELLTANGNTFTEGPANYYRMTREPEDLAETTGQVFLGIRIGCAKCHNHPFERWTQDDYYHLAAFFARVGRKTESGKKSSGKSGEAEVIYGEDKGEVKHLRTGATVAPRHLGGSAPVLLKDSDRRATFADWLVGKDNPYFARAVVNRLWFHLFGKGIVDPPDDFRDSNPAAHPELLEALAADFVKSGFDIKHTLRIVCNSRTYQLGAKSNAFNKDDRRYFARVYPRLLSAEQMLDAMCQATDAAEPFPGRPKGTRAVQVPDGEYQHMFLRNFGQPAREMACECERDGEATLAGALQMLNGATIQARLAEPNNRIGKLLAAKVSDEGIVAELYLATLSRLPAKKEIDRVRAGMRGVDDVRQAWEDIQWALLNSREFLFRH